MKVIVGLGNPGKQYENTRHNAGFMVIDKISKKLNIDLNQNKFKAIIGSGSVNGEKVILVKPQTFMNLSGESLSEIVKFYKLDLEDLLVIFDDLDLEVGQIRLRKKGSSGGQNGMKNIINLLGSQDIYRIRIGIGNDKRISTVDYVLGKVRKEDLEDFNTALEQASEAAIYNINHTFEEAMSAYNKKA